MPHPPFIMLDEKSNSPLYRQIYEAIRRAILDGEFHSTMPLPATRLLAGQLSVSRMTVINAYEQLLAEGYLEARAGAGTFVAAHLPEEFLQTTKVKNQKQSEETAPRKIKVSEYGKNLSENGTMFLQHYGGTVFVPFQQSLPAIDLFPFEVWARIAQRQQKNPSSAILNYGNPAGYSLLREAVAAYLASARGVRCTPEQVVITNGTQQALDLIGRIFLEKKDEVLIEDPCYLGARNIFAATGARIVPVPLDGEGFDLERAKKKSSRARLVYVTPSHQYPLGITMSLKRRLNLLEWAGKNDAFVVEDDYDSEYRYAGRPLASLQGLDRDGRVIYLGTFSKTIFPALRLGYMVVPTDLIEMFTAARAMTDLHSPTVEQAILAEFLADGHFSRHVRRMRGIYAKRQQILVEESMKHLKGLLEIAPDESGMNLIGWLPEGVSDRSVANRAKAMDMRISPISALCLDEKLPGGLLLGYTAFDEKQIKRAVKKLTTVIKEFI